MLDPSGAHGEALSPIAQHTDIGQPLINAEAASIRVRGDSTVVVEHLPGADVNDAVPLWLKDSQYRGGDRDTHSVQTKQRFYPGSLVARRSLRVPCG